MAKTCIFLNTSAFQRKLNFFLLFAYIFFCGSALAFVNLHPHLSERGTGIGASRLFFPIFLKEKRFTGRKRVRKT